MTLQEYISTISQRFQLGNATEHTFRGDLQQLLESLVPEVRATNEPKRQSCGAPDYIITKGEIPVGFIEAKDIGDKDLEGNKKTGNQEQFDRYKSGLANLIITDYLDFHFYKDGILNTKITIGKVENGKIVPLTENFDSFTQLFRNFTTTISQSIKSPTRLAEMMAGKARLMADIIEKSLNEDDEQGNMSNLKRQMLSFQKMLISDIDNKSYSDLYSQTISYGLFAARYHDPSLPTFSREEALKLIPRSNPFLRKLFKDISDDELDSRLVWIVDELVSVFLASDVASIMKDFGKSTKQEDPVVHFYETFLGAYNPSLRKQRGVWYTPQPVVNFIVRAVDDILKTEFGFKEGLADSSKKKIKVNYQGKEIEKEVHRVQVLDFAVGTGTYLSETIKLIHKNYEGMQGIWSKYVEDDLIPRINGFELLMASYAMAHLKLDMLLTDTGYVPTRDQRLKVFLTNTLEEPNQDSGTLWGNILSDESDQANEVKRDTPIMCIIGNPPYSVSSNNKGEWIQNLIKDYKKNLNERKINLDDDYIKFIRYGQHYIDKNGSGVLAFISNNSFIDGITHRQMRKCLLESFDSIYILDLHGNSKKKEVCSDGSPDQNVFDIMQGVSINIFIKTGLKKENELGQVFHSELQGKREFKYETLFKKAIKTIDWKKLEFTSPNYFFVPKNFDEIEKYERGFKIDEIFGENVAGVETIRDSITIHFTSDSLQNVVNDFLVLDESEISKKYNTEDSRDWKISRAKEDVRLNIGNSKVFQNVNYRPFDIRKTFYSGKQNGFVCNGRYNVMKHLLRDNLGFIAKRGFDEVNSPPSFITKFIIDRRGWSRPGMQGAESTFPLYLYPEENGQKNINQSEERKPNLNTEIVNKISEKLGLTFTQEKETTKDTYAPIDILDYIYSVLHSPTYREKYKEFIKIDFPRVPFPKDQDTFWKLVKLGGEIRQIHLLESPVVDKPISKYSITGTNIVGKVKYEDGKVFINDAQYFEDVPEVSWNFYIGGYQPSQKWLKDRKDRELQVEDIRHYLKIIVALSETDRLMKEIDSLEIE
jgi:predicted helicase